MDIGLLNYFYCKESDVCQVIESQKDKKKKKKKKDYRRQMDGALQMDLEESLGKYYIISFQLELGGIEINLSTSNISGNIIIIITLCYIIVYITESNLKRKLLTKASKGS